MPLQPRRGIEIVLIVTATGWARQAPPAFPVEPAGFTQTARAAGEQKKKGDDAKPAVHVAGKVVDRQGNGLTNIDVGVVSADSSIQLKRKTGAGGAFSFEVPPGDYTIKATSGTTTASTVAKVKASMQLPELVLNTEQ